MRGPRPLAVTDLDREGLRCYTACMSMVIPPTNVFLPSASHNGFEIQVSVDDLNSAPRVRVENPTTGETHYLSIEAIENIRSYATGPTLRGMNAVNDMRFMYAHPAQNPDLAGHLRQAGIKPLAMADGNTAELGTWLMAKADSDGADFTEPREGEPKMTWVVGDYAGNGCGWRLVLHGSGETPLGFASWQDAEGIVRLAQMLQDRQSVFVLSGVLDSNSTARLSSRLTALSMRRARKLPAIKLKAVRDILTQARLIDGQTGNPATCARGRVLSIQVDANAVPVAVAIIPPRRPNTCEAIPGDIDTLPWAERQAVIARIESEGRDVWMEKVQTVLTRAGWRIVDLPQPTHSFNMWRVRHAGTSGSGMSMLYVTRIKEDLWGDISAAATAAAGDINLNRTSLL